MQDAFHTSILSTLALAEAENCPALSREALGAYLHHTSGSHENSAIAFAQALDTLVAHRRIRVEHGYYALSSHARAFQILHENRAKKRIAQNEIPLLLLEAIPFLHGAAITGSVALDNATEHSDVDIFCIAEKNRLWTVRALALACAALFLRRRDHSITGEKICLNYFLAGNAQAPIHNIAAANMFARAIPLFERDALTHFFNTNPWIARALHYPQKESLFPAVRTLRGIARVLSIILSGTLGDRIETLLKQWQIRRIEKKVVPESDTSHLILRDDAIVLHYPHSKNKAVMDRYNHRMHALGISPLH